MFHRKTFKKLEEIMIHKNFPLRLLFFIVATIPLLYINDFYHHFYVYLTGNIISQIFIQQWHLVVFSILLFVAFLIPLSFRRKTNWMEYGLVSAFFISLFVEMYGFPLTIFLASKYFFVAGVNLPNQIIQFKIFGIGFGMDLAMSYGTVLITIGTFFIITGWLTLYRNIKKDRFVTNGIYSLSRHPQYFGFILIVVGWFIGWPTILTLVMAPVLIWKYIRVSQTEEKELLKKVPEYQGYKIKTPFFI
ncbi:DUF1295 domain-containing protein [Patescibacteria group bacterium]|nr:DUF1295 domain-containing protein [Patescibacteria group bacterium]